MAQVEQMDIDDIESDFDNKENTFHHSNVLSRTPCTEKGYEELDVSELNMKLRYSVTPSASPMSKSFTGPCLDNRNSSLGEDYLNNTVGVENSNLTRSLNSTLTKTESMIKVKALPLQTISTDPFVDSNRNSSTRRMLDATDDNVTISVSNANDIDENSSLPSTCSSVADTPEATTPTKEIPKPEGSPILRGLKSVLSMFRPSQSPIPPTDDNTQKQEVPTPIDLLLTSQNNNVGVQVLASTPAAVAANKQKEVSRSSPLKESIVFNEDLERELQWKDETTIFFKDEKIPIQKLLFVNPITPDVSNYTNSQHLNTTVEYMDISCDDSIVTHKAKTEIDPNIESVQKEGTVAVESDNEFLDCETTFMKNDSCVSDYKELELGNEIQARENATGDALDDSSAAVNESECQNGLTDTDCTNPEDAILQYSDQTSERISGNNLYLSNEGSSDQTLQKTIYITSQIEGSTLHTSVASSEEISERTTDLALQIEGNSQCPSAGFSEQTLEVSTNITSQIDGNTLHTSVGSSEQTSQRITDLTSKIEGITLQVIEGSSDQTSERITVLASKIEGNSNLIECTSNLLKNEISLCSNDFDEYCSLRVKTQNKNLQNEYPGTNNVLQHEDLNITKSIDENLIKTDGQYDIIEAHPPVMCDIKNNLMTTLYLEVKENANDTTLEIAYDEATYVANLPDVCAKQLNNYDNSKDGLEETDTRCKSIIGKENTELVKDVTTIIVEDSIADIVRNDLACNETVHIKTINVIESVPKNISILNNSENNCNNDTPIVECRETALGIENLNKSTISSDNLESSHTVDSQTNYNVIVNSVIKSANNEDHVQIKNMIDAPVKNIIDTNLPFPQFVDNDIKENICSLNIEQEQAETNPPDNPNHGSHKDILAVDEDTLLLKMCSMETVESQKDRIPVSAIPSGGNYAVSDNDREVPFLMTGNDMVKIFPCEIPLPDDVFEQNIAEPINVENKEADATRDVTVEICEKSSAMDVENLNKLSSEFRDHSSIKRETTETSVIHVFPENDIEINEKVTAINKHITQAQLCDTQSLDTTFEVGFTTCNENIARYETNTDIVFSDLLSAQNTESALQDGSIDGHQEVGQNQAISESQKNTNIHAENIVLVEGMNNDVVASPSVQQKDSCTIETDLAYTANSGDINNIGKLGAISPINDDIQHADSGKEVEEIDEIITSANNSPYVSVINLANENLQDSLENIDKPFAINTKITSPPISPKIISKGYNYNFDEMDDPFATKIKIRTSPTPDSPNQSSVAFDKAIERIEVPKKVESRRKSQTNKKRPAPKKNFYSASSTKLTGKKNISEKTMNITTISTPQEKEGIKEKTSDVTSEHAMTVLFQELSDTGERVTTTMSLDSKKPKDEIYLVDEEKKGPEQALVLSAERSTSSSEQHFSGESGRIMNRSKNVFNLPEIDDANFNPFATKSKMRMSPPPSCEQLLKPIEIAILATNSSFVLQEQPVNNITATEDITFDKNISKDLSPNTSDATCSSKNTNDDDTIVREILTEDEDTIEGPFLEAEDLQDSEKLTDMDLEHNMINFDEVLQEKDENLVNDELFIDADAFQFLLNQKSTTVLDSGKESLFLKFDPLFAKRVSSGDVLAAVSKVNKRQSTPHKITKPTTKESNVKNSQPGPSNEKENYVPVEEYNEDPSSNMTKPMMVVNPAVSSIVTQRRSTATPKLNRRSLTFTSPAIAVIDRLLSLSGNSSHLDHDTSMPNVSRERTNETDLAITQLRELLAEKEINVHNLRSESKELKNRLAALEVQVKNLETESTDRLNKIKSLSERLSEKTKINKSMATVVEEYERTIASLIAETEQDKKRNAKERVRLVKERDEQTAHLTSMEVSFSDLHSKYEKSKQIILGFKANEDTYKKSIKEFEENFSKMQNNYELLKQHATSKLNHANQELEKMNRAHEAEVLKLNAMIKRKDLHITSLEETLAQKTKANEELTAICDELINKVG